MTAPIADPAVLEALAGLLEYPREGLAQRARAARAALDASPPVADACRRFLDRAEAAPLFEMEELYARTFDWSPERALEVGWHLYGEQYDRGAFLVRVRGMLRAHGVEEGQDLPDHLGTILRLLARAPAEGDLLPAVARAVERMGAAFAGPEADNPYGDVVRAAREALAPAACCPGCDGAPR